MELRNELRIGSWISYHGRYVQTDVGDLIMMGEGNNYYEPIPLNDHVLEACGFWYDDILDRWIQKPVGFTLETHLARNMSVEGYVYPRIIGTEVILRHLHELQLLFYIITGRELNFNLKKIEL